MCQALCRAQEMLYFYKKWGFWLIIEWVCAFSAFFLVASMSYSGIIPCLHLLAAERTKMVGPSLLFSSSPAAFLLTFSPVPPPAPARLHHSLLRSFPPSPCTGNATSHLSRRNSSHEALSYCFVLLPLCYSDSSPVVPLSFTCCITTGI